MSCTVVVAGGAKRIARAGVKRSASLGEDVVVSRDQHALNRLGLDGVLAR
jgi:NAD(P)-dependent dehydrogenase (short-subunit alcohol dehydrogenase family)